MRGHALPPPGAAELVQVAQEGVELDLEHCPNCSAEPKIITAIACRIRLAEAELT